MNVVPAAPPTWVTVFHGPFTKALALQALLEAGGIPTRVPDETTKLMDPFLTGANPLAVRLCVPQEAFGAARELLHAPIEAARAAAEPPTELEADEAECHRLSRIVRWCLVFGPPGWCASLVFGPRYLRAARALATRPPGHVRTLAIWALQLLCIVCTVAIGAAVPVTHALGAT